MSSKQSKTAQGRSMKKKARAATAQAQATAPGRESTPDIRLLFDGLFFVCFPPPVDGKISEGLIGILSTVLGHELSININGRMGGSAPVSYALSPSRQMVRALREVTFSAEGQDEVTIFDPPIDRLASTGDPKSFRWAIDFENDEMHNMPMPIRARILRPVMRVRAGEFYTEKVSEETYLKFDEATGVVTQFGSVARTVGVRLNLPEGRNALLEVKDLLRIPISRSTADPSALNPPITIRFDNRCPESKEGNRTGPLPIPSDLHFYYQAFDIPADRWIDLQPSPAHATPPAICYPTRGTLSTSIP